MMQVGFATLAVYSLIISVWNPVFIQPPGPLTKPAARSNACGASKTLAAGTGNHIGKINASVYRIIMQNENNFVIVVDSKDFYNTMKSKRQSINRTIHGDIVVIPYAFEMQTVAMMVWIPGKFNTADIGTKFDSPFSAAVCQMLSSGKIPFAPIKSESWTSDRSLG